MTPRRLAALALAGIFGVVAVFVFLDKWLFVADDLVRADVCHVLGGPEYRALYAFDLYRQGLCGELLFIGGREGGEISLAARRRDLALREGLPAQALRIDESDVYSSFAEIDRLKAFLDNRGNEAGEAKEKLLVTLVSDAYHMRRLRMIWSWIVGNEAHLQLAAVPFARTPMPRRWWSDMDSIETVGTETAKIAFYLLRYRFPSTTLRDWFARFDKLND